MRIAATATRCQWMASDDCITALLGIQFDSRDVRDVSLCGFSNVHIFHFYLSTENSSERLSTYIPLINCTIEAIWNTYFSLSFLTRHVFAVFTDTNCSCQTIYFNVGREPLSPGTKKQTPYFLKIEVFGEERVKIK